MNKIDGGDCGCNSKITGGGGIPPLADMSNDPQRFQESVRMNRNINGGKRKMRKSKTSKKKRSHKRRSTYRQIKRRKSRKMRGGNVNSPAYTDGIAFSTGSLSGSFIGSNILSGAGNASMNPSMSNFQERPFI